MRKAQDDVMARSAAERTVADSLVTTSDGPAGDSGLSVGQWLAQQFPAVEFERGTSRTPDGQKVPMRRIVLTGAWEVDPDGLRTQE